MFKDREHTGRIQFSHTYEDIISIENLLGAWREFIAGKRKKTDVQIFQRNLMDNLYELHEDLKNGNYHHGPYHAFCISDPKPRDIHKASVRDRLLHHALYRKLYPFFDRSWISDSYSCRINKGTHRAMDRFRHFARKVSRNETRTCWVLKCDIRKFFASIDQNILFGILEKYITDQSVLNVLHEIVGSFRSSSGKGLPLGNLTSQLLVNVYMNEFDQFAKHHLKAHCYIRYADDFVVLSNESEQLNQMLQRIDEFLKNTLNLTLHPHKVCIQTFTSGVDFLGWVHFPDHRILRTSTKKRMVRNLDKGRSKPRIMSYKGLLSHGNARKIASLAGVDNVHLWTI